MSWDADAEPIIGHAQTILPPVLALTGCCPRLRRTGDLTPTAWQQLWADMTYRTWLTTRQEIGQLPRWAAMVNWSDVGFAPPSPETMVYPTIPIAWPALDCLWALFVLDRIRSPRIFLREIGKVLQPGGVLACSFAYWNADGPDCATGHESRRRIYNKVTVQALIKEDATPCGLRVFGGTNWQYRGDACGEYTIGTLVLQKQKEEA